MAKKISINEKFMLLTMRQKVCLLLLMCALSLGFLVALMPLLRGSADKIKAIGNSAAESKLLVARIKNVENDLKNLSETMASVDAFDKAEICEKIESAAKHTGSSYKMEEIESSKLEKFLVFRIRVSFGVVQFGMLVEFLESVCKIASNIAISELKIVARANGQLEAYCIVSILSSEHE
jgi:hypothetical protein